jgi:hypothetical protein
LEFNLKFPEFPEFPELIWIFWGSFNLFGILEYFLEFSGYLLVFMRLKAAYISHQITPKRKFDGII